VVAEAARQSGIHVVTLYRWIKFYEETERVSALIPTKRDGGRGRSRLDEEVEKILNATIEDHYLKKQKRSISNTCKEVERRYKNAGLEPPHDVEVYHQRLHSSLKMSPVRKYEEGVFGNSDKPGTGLPARITDEDRLHLDFMPLN
jgi:putative transposase